MLPHYDDHSYKPNTIELDDGVVIKARRPKKNKNLGSDYHENDTFTTKLNSEYATRREDKNSKHKASAKDLLSFLDDTAEDNVTTVKTEI